MYKKFTYGCAVPMGLQQYIYRVMKLTTFLIVITFIQVSAAGFAQQVSFRKRQASLPEIFAEINKQTGYNVFWSPKLVTRANLVDADFVNAAIPDVLDQVLKNQQLAYEILGKSIVIKVRADLPVDKELILAYPEVRGRVVDSLGKPLQGASIRVLNAEGKRTTLQTSTDKQGEFLLQNVPQDAMLEISFVGYVTQKITANANMGSIVLSELSSELEEASVIVNTGYQNIPKERATGSFVFIDSALLNRRVSTNILDRLEGVTSGLLFNGTAATTIYPSSLSSGTVLGINIRGTSTLSSSVNQDPLIVVDNFPYEGNMSNLNPDIESITILKDAAAASIWGVRAGNGVIVITTKHGKMGQPLLLSFNTNFTIQNKPDVFKDKNRLSSSDYIEVEKYLFRQGYFDDYIYDNYSFSPYSPVVELLSQQRLGKLSTGEADEQIAELGKYDVRNDFEKYIYQTSMAQQYALSLAGSGQKTTYAFNASLDKKKDNLWRNGLQRITLAANNTYMPNSKLEFSFAFNYAQNNTDLNNQLSWGNISVGSPVAGIYPYARLADGNGNALAIVKDYSSYYLDSISSYNLLDWRYRPLDEIRNAENTIKLNDILLKGGLKYDLLPGLDFSLQYQFERQNMRYRTFYSQQTYFARDLINRFSIVDPATGTITNQVPVGGILDLQDYDVFSQNGRLQALYDRSLGRLHHVTAIAGAEIRQSKSEGYSRRSYGYDDEFGTSNNTLDFLDYLAVLPNGSDRISSPDGGISSVTNRYVSYYVNLGYTYNDRYTLNLSGRKDGANIFGVKSNDKITPLWSIGAGWDVGQEKFYALPWLPRLRLRASYGFNGNVYNGSAYVTGNYDISYLTGAKAIYNLTAPNPSLSWEKVKNINIGVDFSSLKDILSGTIEYYQKDGEGLIDNISLAPSSGFSSFTGNAAGTRTTGLDISLTSQNINKAFKWSSTLLMSTLRDKVTQYNQEWTSTTIQQTGGVPAVGKPLYGMYGYRWGGLDAENGNPVGYMDGEKSEDYSSIINNYQPDSLILKGSARPTLYGALRNDFSYKGFSLSFNITYSLGYYFRRSSTSLNYSSLISTSYSQNEDYTMRWQSPGDEKYTNVPSLVYPSDINRNNFYKYSEHLLERADNIRLQDIRIAYQFNRRMRPFPFKTLQLYGYVNNVGIIWRKNLYHLDPDLQYLPGAHTLPAPVSFSFGLTATF